MEHPKITLAYQQWCIQMRDKVGKKGRKERAHLEIKINLQPPGSSPQQRASPMGVIVRH